MGTKGILKAFIDKSSISENTYRNYLSNGVLELKAFHETFVAYLDPKNLESIGKNTTNPNFTASKANWVIIREHVWDSLLEGRSNNELKKAFELLDDSLIVAKANETSKVIVNSKEFLQSLLLEGVVFLLIPYSNYPEKSAAIKFVYLKPEPNFIYTFFTQPKVDKKIAAQISKGNDSSNDEKLHVYGQTASILIYTHGFNTKKNKRVNTVVKIEGEVFSEGVGSPIDTFSLEEQYLDSSEYNHSFSYDLFVNPEWRDKSKHKKDKAHRYVVQLKATIYESIVKQKKKTYFDVLGLDQIVNPDKILITSSPKIITNDNKIIKWNQLNIDTGLFESMHLQSYLKVKWEPLSVILADFEVEKSNMVTKIGDVEYTIRENNPCGFERIFIKDLATPDRKDFLLFNEKELLVEDKSAKSFDIIRGDNELKDVNIRIEGLTNLSGVCQHILLEQNESHAELKHLINFDHILSAKVSKSVFKIDSITISDITDSSKSEEDNVRVVKEERKQVGPVIFSQPPPVLSSGTKENNYVDSGYEYEESKTIEGDYDLISDKAKVDGASIMGWKEGIDFKRRQSGTNALVELINIKYTYNKSLETRFDNDLANKAVDSLWCFNHFFLNHKKDKQLFFVPVSTCRYPNQIVRFGLYPDIKWEINFFWNTKDPVWFGSVNPMYDVYSTNKDDSRVKSTIELNDLKSKEDYKALGSLIKEERDISGVSNSSKKKRSTVFNRGMGDMMSEFGVSIKADYNGESHKLSVGFAEDLREMLGVLKQVYDLIDRITGAKDARNAKSELKIEKPGMLKRLNMMSLELKAPAPSLGFSWGYKTIEEQVALELKGKVKCSPVIGADLKIDLLALANKIPVYGDLVTALDVGTWVLEKLSFGTLEIDYKIDLTFYSNLSLEEAYISYLSFADNRRKLDADLSLSGTFGGKLELNVKAKTKVKKDVEWSFEAGVVADCYFKILVSPNFDMGNKVDLTVDFSGLIVTVIFKVEIKRGRENYKKPKESDPIKLISKHEGEPLVIKFK